MSACDKHKANPVKGYSQCAGCEVEALQAERDTLRQQFADVAEGNTKLHVLWTGAVRQRDKLAGLLRDISSSESRGLDWAKQIDAALAEVSK